MVPAQSLFDPPAQSAFGASLGWIGDTLLGELAIGLCVVAVAFIGFEMMMGRLPVRRGMRVVLGCLVLLGAPGMALALAGFAERSLVGASSPAQTAGPQVIYEREELPPADYNPYARASMRRN